MERLMIEVTPESGRQITLTTQLDAGTTLTISRAAPNPQTLADKDVTALQIELPKDAQKLLQHRLELLAAGAAKQ